jgi:tripartite-type tricarboxylate transporter receptor subunit TctC
MSRELFAGVALLAIAGFAFATGCDRSAAAYPSKPITIVAPFAAGGASDVTARALAAVAPRYIGQSIVVVNRPGASGVVGSNFVKNAAPDGYTLVAARLGSQVIAPAVDRKNPYKWNEFTYLATLEQNPFVFAVKAGSPITSFSALLDLLKERPGRLSYGASGPHSIHHLGPQLLFQELGVGPAAAVMVPFQGGGEVATALVGGHVDFVGINLSEIFNQVRNRQIRVLAVASPSRLDMIPDAPTFRELNHPDLERLAGWGALAGPPGLPADVIAKWTDALPKIAADPEWRGLMARSGSIPAVRPPDGTRVFIGDEFMFYADLARKLSLVK